MVAAAAVDPRYRKVVFLCASQMGKTQIVLAIIGHRIDDDPVPVIYLGPTRTNVDTVIEPRLQHMLTSVPELDMYLVKGRQAQKLAKKCKGVSIRLAWAGSATEVASQSAGLTIADEVDRMEDIPGEGDPVALLEKRMERYPDGTMLVDSTPTLGNVDVFIHPETGVEHWAFTDTERIFSRAWLMWQAGTRHEYAMPCQADDCGEYFVPRFRHCHWPQEGSNLARSMAARLCCPRCGHEHDDKAIRRVLNDDLGRAIAPGQRVVNGEVVGEPPETLEYSIWVSGVMSKDSGLSKRVYDWLQAVDTKKDGVMQAVMNTSFGELWAVAGERPAASVIDECVGAYSRNEVLPWVRRIILSVDVQGDRLEYVIRGWGYKLSSALIDQGELYGDTLQDPVWDQLDELLEAPFGDRSIDYLVVDAGYRTDKVLAFVAQRKTKAFAVMGEARSKNKNWMYLSKPRPDRKGRRPKSRDADLWMVNSSYFKSLVYDRFKADNDKPGKWLVYQGIDEGYKSQVTAEARIQTKDGNGWVWKPLGENHKLDCEYMNLAIAEHTKKEFSLLPDDEYQAANESRNSPGRHRRRKGSYL